MRLKSYFAGTVEAAMSLAAKELGEDAMLVYSREATPETRYLGRYEVVFALPEDKPKTAEEPRPVTPIPTVEVKPQPKTELGVGPRAEPAPSDTPVLEQVLGELSMLRTSIAEFRASSPSVTFQRRLIRAAGPFAEVQDRLHAAEIDDGMWMELLRLLKTKTNSGSESEILRMTRGLLAGAVQIDSRAGVESGGRQTLVFVGPPGAGKTTSLVKIAAQYVSRSGNTPHLISFDNSRIGGHDQLRTFASILGATFCAVTDCKSLGEELDRCSDRDLILVDTAGYAERDLQNARELTGFLASRSQLDVHLTLSASMKPADLTRAVQRFRRFRPDKLLFTRLDETKTLGPVWSEAVREDLPLSFFGEGQQIPEDLQPADAAWLSNILIGSEESIPEPEHAPVALVEKESNSSTQAQQIGWTSKTFAPLRKSVWTGGPLAG
jgi:flagellar biosynthesis protein FlhF